MTPPLFVIIGNRIINVAQIKWVGMKEMSEGQRVYVEFVTGGWVVLDSEVTLDGFSALLRKAMEEAAPF